MLRLPVDLSTFSEMINSGYLYIDKTKHVYNMITGGRRYFMSRPRRFGKSLLVSTLKETLTANKKLFKGLWIEQSDYHWHEYGVINLDFSKIDAHSVDSVKHHLCNMLIRIANTYQLSPQTTTNDPSSLLEDVVDALYKQFNRVAILVDEYDSPILKNIHNEERARAVRDTLQQFFTTIKALDSQIQFVFITGVSSFAKAGLFSGINNVQIITMNKQFADICGYTDEEVDHYFPEYIKAWAEEEQVSYDNLRQKIREWYNGYHFEHNAAAVYNPFSLMNALHLKSFENFWFQSGAPTFLIEILKKEYKSFDPHNLETSKDTLGIFDIGAIPLISLMFQAGYLTIVDYDPNTHSYKLDYPNSEVRVSFQKYLLEVFAHIEPFRAQTLSTRLRIAFDNQDMDAVVETLQELFMHVPYQLHSSEEKYYHGLFTMICVSSGMKAQAEYSTILGSIDLILDSSSIFYIIEIKFNKSAKTALKQIEERKYYEKFMVQNKPIILLGLSFKRKPNDFKVDYALKNL